MPSLIALLEDIMSFVLIQEIEPNSLQQHLSLDNNYHKPHVSITISSSDTHKDFDLAISFSLNIGEHNMNTYSMHGIKKSNPFYVALHQMLSFSNILEKPKYVKSILKHRSWPEHLKTCLVVKMFN